VNPSPHLVARLRALSARTLWLAALLVGAALVSAAPASAGDHYVATRC